MATDISTMRKAAWAILGCAAFATGLTLLTTIAGLSGGSLMFAPLQIGALMIACAAATIFVTGKRIQSARIALLTGLGVAVFFYLFDLVTYGLLLFASIIIGGGGPDPTVHELTVLGLIGRPLVAAGLIAATINIFFCNRPESQSA